MNFRINHFLSGIKEDHNKLKNSCEFEKVCLY